MSITNSTIVTSAGLNFVTSAYDAGPLIAIKYWLPCYDYRTDPQVHDGTETTVIDLSAAASASDTTPYGEIIWNISTAKAYSLTIDDNQVLSAGGETLDVGDDPWILTDSIISKEQQVNLYDGTTLSNYISGTDVDASATSNAWEITGGVRVVGDNSVPAETSAGNNRYFEVVDYYPVTDGNILKGSFKCRLNKKIGTVKFNKIALYVTQVDAQGNDTSNPTLFAEAMLSSPIIKTNYGTDGFDDIVIDVQIQIGSVSTNFSDVFFATSADYWQRTVGGVYYPEKVGIGTFDDGTEQPKAKLHIKSNSSLPQLRLDWGLGTSALTSAALYETSGGDLVIKLNDTPSSIRPYVTGYYNLGSSDYKFNYVYGDMLRTNMIVRLDYDYLYFYGDLYPYASNTWTLGSTTRRVKTGYFNNINSTSATIDYIEPTSANSGPSGYSRLGSSIAPYKYLFIDSILNPGSNENIKFLDTVEPFIDDTYRLGTSNKRFSRGYINKLHLSNRINQVAGEWNALTGRHNWNGSGSTWTTLADDFKIRTGNAVSIYNTTLWDWIVVSDFTYTIIAKTIIVKFLCRFKKSDTTTDGSTNWDLCVLTPDSTTDGSPLQQIVRDGKDTATIYYDNYRMFPSILPVTGVIDDPPVYLRVKYYNGEFYLNVVYKPAYYTTVWENKEHRFFVTLIYEIS